MCRAIHAICLTLLLSFSGSVYWLNSMRASAADSANAVQLVRLNVSTDSTGQIRIEVIADGALGETAIERFERGGESVIRIRGARSLLRSNYVVSGNLAESVRTFAGERNGEPFVDVVIVTNDFALVAPKKSFNRLVIGVTPDLARSNKRAPSPASVQSQSGRDAGAPREVAISSAPVTDSIPSASSNSVASSSSNSRVVSQPQPVAVNTLASPLPVASQPVGALAVGPQIFRGRTLWVTLPVAPLLSRFDASAFPLMYFQDQNNALAPALLGLWSFVPMTLEAPGASQGDWIPGTTTSVRDEVGGRQFGKGVLRPSFMFGGEFDDNFFYRSQVGRNVGIFTFAPRLEYEIPGDKNALRIAYEYQIRRLTNGQWANGQTFDFDSRFEISRYMRFALRNHFVRSALDPREYDPAGEVYIVGDTFTRNDAAARMEFILTPRDRLALDADYNLVTWSDEYIASAPLFINYDELSGSLSYERDVSEQTTATASFTYGVTDSSAPLRAQFNGLNDRRRYAIELGMRTQISDASGVLLRAGYERSTFQNAPDVNDYSGLVFNLAFRRNLTENTNLELAALRKTQVSSFNLEGGNARLLSTGATGRLESKLSEAMKLGLALNYQQLGFPVAVTPLTTASGGVFLGGFAGERRKDHLYGFALDASYQWSDILRTRFAYTFSRRDSTIPVLTFNRNRLSLVFEFGRRNNVRGRPF